MALTAPDRPSPAPQRPARRLPPGTAWAPAPWDPADITAVQQVMYGRADEIQQKRAMAWIIEKVCGTYEFHYHPSERDTAFALGRAFAGQQIIKATKLNVSRMRSQENDNRNDNGSGQ
jgi:hypothetical protein